MSQVELRRLRWWDLDDVLQIETAAFPDTAWTAAMFWSELAGVPSSREYLAAVGADSGQLVGYAGLFFAAPQADIQTIAVADEVRGKGVGALLLDALLGSAGEHGCSEVLLEVRDGNAAAIALYESRGFQVIARRRDYYGIGLDALAMRRRSTSAGRSDE